MLLSLGLQSLIFPPLPTWPLAFVCLAPWLLIVAGSPRPRRVYVLSYLLGFGFYLINMYWMYYPTGAGYVAASAYLASYLPLVAIPVRHAARRRRIPLTFVLPFVWVGAEWLRSLLLSGFPWFFLGHAAYRWLSLIQISDVAGAYGVSFIIATVNGALADALMRWRTRPTGARMPAATIRWSQRLRRPTVAWPLGLLLAALIYGQVQLHRSTTAAGPKIAVLQGNFLSAVEGEREDPHTRFEFYATLLMRARTTNADLYALPETPLHMTLNREFLELDTTRPENWGWGGEQAVCRRWAEAFMAYSQANGAYLVTGGFSRTYNAYDLLCAERQYNSAFVFGPDGELPQRYDKVHLVLFGEAVPLRFGRLRFLYLWLNRMTPWGGPFDDYSLFAGDTFRTFAMTTGDGRTFRFGIPICYEDVMPYITRRFVTGRGKGAAERTREGKQIDFILNISNDGWFAHSTELPQHLAISAFRAVENRIGVARAVNTGISAFIDSDGRIHHVVEVDGRRRGPRVDGYQVANVCVDSRFSLYSRWGDVFAWLCAAIWALLGADYIVARIRGYPAAPATALELKRT